MATAEDIYNSIYDETPSSLLAGTVSNASAVVPSPTVTPSDVEAAPTFTGSALDVTRPTDLMDVPGQFDTTPEALVSGQLSNLLRKDTPLSQLNEAKAKEAASRYGMLGSTMSIGAGQRALYETALPIAQQDADTYRQSLLSRQIAEQDQAMEGYKANLSTQLSAQEYSQQAGLAAQQGKIDILKQTLAGDQSYLTTLLGEEGAYARQELQGDQQLEQLEKQLSAQLEEAYAKIDADLVESYTDQYTDMYQQYIVAYADIQMTADDVLDADSKEVLLTELNEGLMSTLEALDTLYGAETDTLIDWNNMATESTGGSGTETTTEPALTVDETTAGETTTTTNSNDISPLANTNGTMSADNVYTDENGNQLGQWDDYTGFIWNADGEATGWYWDGEFYNIDDLLAADVNFDVYYEEYGQESPFETTTPAETATTIDDVLGSSTAMSSLQTDLDNWYAVPTGTTASWAGGQITKYDGYSVYSDGSNSYTITDGASPSTWANTSSNIASQWVADYGGSV